MLLNKAVCAKKLSYSTGLQRFANAPIPIPTYPSLENVCLALASTKATELPFPIIGLAGATAAMFTMLI